MPDKRHFWIEFRRLATNGSLFTYAVQARVPYIRNTLTYVITLQQQCGSTSNESGEDNRGAGSAVVKGVVVRVMFRITAAMRYYRLWIYTCNTGKTQLLRDSHVKLIPVHWYDLLWQWVVELKSHMQHTFMVVSEDF